MIGLGVDYGGSKIEAAVLDVQGRFLARERLPNPKGYETSLQAVKAVVEQAEAAAGLGRAEAVGVAMPGSLSPKTGLARNANSTWLNGRPFREDLEQALGRPVRVANDANCLALSEAVDGAGRGAGVVLAVILGTGCGAGVTAGGRIIEGRNGFAGEWGHAPLPWPQADEWPLPACWCGQAGCLELYISGTGFADDYRRTGGEALAAPAVVERMRAGEPAAAGAFDRYADRLGRALACACNLIDPDAIVLGGGMSNVEELYPRLPGLIASRVFSDVFDTPIRPAMHGDSSGVRGAAWLWPAGPP